LNEIRALKIIKSPYVVKMFDAYILENGNTIVVMEFIDGCDLL